MGTFRRHLSVLLWKNSVLKRHSDGLGRVFESFLVTVPPQLLVTSGDKVSHLQGVTRCHKNS